MSDSEKFWRMLAIFGVVIVICGIITAVKAIQAKLRHKRVSLLKENRQLAYELSQLREENYKFSYEAIQLKNENGKLSRESNRLVGENFRIPQLEEENRQLSRELLSQLKERKTQNSYELLMLKEQCKKLTKISQERENALKELFTSNLTAMPFLAGMMADYITYDLEILVQKLDWGSSQERAKKVKSIRQIRAEAKEKIEQAKLATYQLEYLKTLYPALEDVVETPCEDVLATHNEDEIPDYDPIRRYITKEEWENLSTTEKNQRALDNYILSRKKSNWQIGRDYELYFGYILGQWGYVVDYFGSYMGLEDLGRDLIAKKDGDVMIVQCKYWSQQKQIHEKHIFQLYGSVVCYGMEKKIPMAGLQGLFVTNISLSPMAKKVAKKLHIEIVENHPIEDFPRIKCNIGRDEFGGETRIYHLPMDQQYDNTRIDKDGEFFAMTVAEAERAGFRRAYRWHSEEQFAPKYEKV